MFKFNLILTASLLSITLSSKAGVAELEAASRIAPAHSVVSGLPSYLFDRETLAKKQDVASSIAGTASAAAPFVPHPIAQAALTATAGIATAYRGLIGALSRHWYPDSSAS